MTETISGIKHPAFRDALALARPAARAETGRYLVEGIDLVEQALVSPSPVWAVFAAPETAADVEAACAARRTPLYLTSASLIARLVGTSYETAVAAVAVVGQRLVAPDELLQTSPNALILAGERIQDPRNTGVLVRTAEAAGCAALLLSNDSAEPFSRQAVRSTTGSILRLPICLARDLPATLRELRAAGTRIVATSARASAIVWDADLRARPLTLVVGNETEGLSAAARAAASEFVSLPTAPGGASSLNVTVAAGALLYEALRQRRP